MQAKRAHMNIHHLREKGWSEEEILHAVHLFAQAEKRKHPTTRLLEHSSFLTLSVLMTVGAIALSLLAFPLFLMGTIMVGIPFTAMLGACLGLLFIHALWDLKPKKHHHLFGASIIVAVCFLTITLLINILGEKILMATGEKAVSGWIVASALCAGIITPYIAGWRHHEPQ